MTEKNYDGHPMKPTAVIPGLVWMSNDVTGRSSEDIQQSFATEYQIPPEDIYVLRGLIPAAMSMPSVYVDARHEPKVKALWTLADRMRRLYFAQMIMDLLDSEGA